MDMIKRWNQGIGSLSVYSSNKTYEIKIEGKK